MINPHVQHSPLSYFSYTSIKKGTGWRSESAMAQQGRGKSGGVRIIYYNKLDNGEIWLLTIYAKGDQSTIPSHELKVIKEAIDCD